MPPARRRRAAPRARGGGGGAEEVIRAARAGACPPLLVMTGPDVFTRDALVALLRGACVAEGFEPFDEAMLWGDTASGEEIVGQAGMLPMGGKRRFVRVRLADRLREKDAACVGEYADDPAPKTSLVLTCEGGKSPLAAAMKGKGIHLEFPAPRDYQLARWIEMQADRLGIPIEAGASRALADRMGENWIGAFSELRRAAVSLPEGRRIGRDAIASLAGQGRDTNPFHLSDAILSREPARAVGILRDLHDAGVTGYAILGMLEAQLRRFLKMRARVDAGEPASRVIQSTSPTLPPAVRERLVRQLEGFRTAALVQAFRLAREADRAIKTGGSGTEPAHMEALVWRLCDL